MEATEAPSPSTGAASVVRATEAPEAPSLPAGSLRHTLQAKGARLQHAPSPNKTAGLNWKAKSTTAFGLIARSLRSLMGLIDRAWADRHAMLRWITDEVVAACADAAELGVPDSALGDLPHSRPAARLDLPYTADGPNFFSADAVTLPRTHGSRVPTHARQMRTAPRRTITFISTRPAARAATTAPARSRRLVG